ncbi:Fic family protein, partial [Candidatus Woesearchaeota archaeon]|nr:Fic family protein [Candidatus Woesearchaeota archaeon]
MVYHEIRVVNGKKQNYLVYNSRKNNKWVKKSKFVGLGDLNKKEISVLKKEFEKEIILNKKYIYLELENIEEIEDLKKIYNEKIKKLKKEEYEKFQKSFFTELTYNSNAIEGSSLNLEETSLVVNDKIVPEGKTLREIYEAKGHMEALNFIKIYKGDLNEEFILKIHSLILKNISERFSGKYRETNVSIFGSDVKLPNYFLVPQLMKNLIYWYKKNKKNYHPVEMAILISMKLVTIHPFVDGNGRVFRLIMNFLLNKKKYPWINIYNKQRQRYLLAVRKAN